MALIRPNAEHREALQIIYERYGDLDFLQNEVRDKVSKSIFRKLCDYNFIVKDGKHMLVTKNSNPDKRNHTHIVNIWRVNMNDGLVKKYVKGKYSTKR